VTNSNPPWWTWVKNGARFHIQNENGQHLYEVGESGADKTGTWWYKRTDGLMIGPLTLGPTMILDHPTPDAAMSAAERDYRQIVRLTAWFNYMVNNNPPG
jgi:hypothetical protein